LGVSFRLGKDSAMRPAYLYDIVFLGTAIRFLQEPGTGWVPHAPGGIIENYDVMKQRCDDLGLVVTSRAASQLLGRAIDRFKSEPEDYKTTPADAEAIRSAMDNLRAVLDAEAMGKFVYVTVERRFDAAKLLDNPGELFAPQTFARLSDLARFDMREACRCLVFGVPTAAAFHLLRGIEDVVRHYYRVRVRRNRLAVPMWGPMVDHMRRLRRPPPAVLLNHLDNIRVAYRNPTQHPEKVYDIDEAQDLLGLCIEVLNRMARELPE
jgi:hypothetical protein